MRKSERGQAGLEAIGALATLALFLFALVTVCYLLFARVWIQYQSEQALYCLAESRPSWVCRSELTRNLERLQFGNVSGLSVFALNDQWIVQFQWRWKWPSYIVRVHKNLSTRMIVGNNKDLLL